jgi:hypothetical protein
MSVEEHPHYTAEQGLARLKEGNERFANGQARFPTVQKDVLAELAKGQQPYATILGCSDSRVPPELVFDAGFGELFVIRVAGNVLGPSILGTLQYAASHLHTPLFVVLGHECCGAVKAAIASKFEGATHKKRIEILLENILPARWSRSGAAGGGAVSLGGGSQCAPDRGRDPSHARGAGPVREPATEADRRGVRHRVRAGPVSRTVTEGIAVAARQAASGFALSALPQRRTYTTSGGINSSASIPGHIGSQDRYQTVLEIGAVH